MKKIFSILFALVLVVGLGLTITAPVVADPGATYYVSTTGSDVTGDGSDSDRWLTIQHAVDQVSSGDTIMVAAGEYDAFLVADKPNINIISTEGATITTANLHWIEEGPIEDAWVMAGVYRSENINIQGINFDGTNLTEEDVIAGIDYVDSTGRIADLTVENIFGTALGAGVAVIDKEGTSTVEITGCTISNNDIGIWVLSDSTQEAHFNNIVGNTDYGVWNYGVEMVDAIYNWWGHTSGPYHPTANPGGSGNPVDDNVDFEPWLETQSVTQTVEGNTIDAIDEANTRVVVNGTATVTIAKYTSNPYPQGPPSEGEGEGEIVSLDLLAAGVWEEVDDTWVDISTTYTESGTQLEIQVYYTDAALVKAGIDDESTLQVFWQHPTQGWLECCPDSTDSGVEPGPVSFGSHDYSGYMWAKIRGDTSPSLSALNGTTFGGYGHPSEDSNGGCGMATLADVTPFALVLVGIVAVWATKRKGKVS